MTPQNFKIEKRRNNEKQWIYQTNIMSKYTKIGRLYSLCFNV